MDKPEGSNLEEGSVVGAEGKEQVKGSGVCGACGAVVWCGCVKGGKGDQIMVRPEGF